jgi:broad specificity phosphatase PhoE
MIIYLSRHGQSIYNTEDRIGGNSDLSPSGQIYALKLASYINNIPKLEIWTSTLIRTIHTAILCNHTQKRFKKLDEINAGDFEDLTYTEVKTNYLEDYNKRKLDKLTYKYSNGESYLDLIKRVKPFVKKSINKSKEKPLLIVAHQAVLRVIYGKLMKYSNEEIPHLSIPLHTLFKLKLDKNGQVISEEKKFFEV